MNSYDHTKIENNWKDKWYKDNIYKAVDFDKRPKQYILAELPYPSGEYLHVGHMMRYTVPEIYSRFLRMRGFNVLYPMGWDCFGLPAETFAIKAKKTPQEIVAEAQINFKKSMQDMGYAIDWDREINTSDPKYYKWTQWIFLKLWENNLVEQRQMPVWWCEQLGVLADEEVLSDAKSPTGKISERGGYVVYKKDLKQWVLKITEYADKLLEGLKDVDYFESVKNGQINWIGRKEGAYIDYPVMDSNEIITCFTTRPDTNYGATFIVLAPEHKFSIEAAKNNNEVKKYVDITAIKTEEERREEKKDKTGVFTGLYALNRLNNKKIPIWISDFVLGDYGTGAVVGVPAHDLRDNAFAKKFNLEIVQVIEPPKNNNDEIFTDYGTSINSGIINGLDSKTAIIKIIEYLEKNKWGKKAVTYNLRDQIWSRQRYWGDPIPLIHKKDGSVEADNNLPVELPLLNNFISDNGLSPLENVPDWCNTKAKDGTPAKRETDTMPTWAGSNWYYMRYIDPNNDKSFADFEKLKYWMPVDKYFGDAGHTNAHLLYTRFWYKFLYEKGYVPTPEPIKWRMSGGLLLGADRTKMSKSKPEFMIDPQDIIKNYGADATRLYLAFIGPYEETYPWNENGIKACYRFITNVYQQKSKLRNDIKNKDLEFLYHRMLKNITGMLEDLKMNTAVSQMMIFINECKKVDEIDKNMYLDFLKVLSPFAPFTTEELWQELNGYKGWEAKNSIHLQSWPKYDETMIVTDEITIPVQINGKLRAEIIVEKDLSEQKIKDLVNANENIKKHLDNKNIKKFIYIPNKIVNLVV